MKQPPFTAAPLMGAESRSFSLRKLLTGHLSSDAYYEAHREDNGVYILWMEFSRFGTLYAYPCVLREQGREPLVFRAAREEDNRALLDRWNELVTAESFSAFRPGVLKKSDFQRIYDAYKKGSAEG